MGFEAGGYFADTTGWVATGLALALAISAITLGRPPNALTRPLGWAAGLLALFGIWVLLSGTWGDDTTAALIEFDRALLYLLVLLLFGVAPWPELTLRRLPAAFLLAAVALCGAGVLIRTLPEAWPFALPPLSARMDYPITYENALGVLAALGLVFSIHLASWRRERIVTRALAAAAAPVLVVALVLTFSRGGTLVAVIGPLAYVVLARPRGAPAALLAAGPFVFLAARAALDADLLATLDARTPAGREQGEDLAAIAAAGSVAAGLLLAFVIPIEERLKIAVPRVRRRTRRMLLAGLAASAVVAIAVLGATGQVREVYDRVVEQDASGGEQQARDRLTDPSAFADVSAQNRPKYWRVSLDGFEERPLRGHGAGSFARLWARDRPVEEAVTEGHSLYLETLAELGLVGAVLLLAALAAVLWPAFGRLRGHDGPLYACLLAAALTWLLHAALDWDWELPVVTLWLFAMGGCALGALPPRVAMRSAHSWPWRAVAVGGLGLVALTPATIALSQSRLNDSVAALRRGDCARAQRSAESSLSVLGLRPEPYEVLAYCSSRRGDHRVAREQMERALERRPQDWRLHYGLALVLGRARQDPRPPLRRARDLNPREGLFTRGRPRELFSTDDPRVWRRIAQTAPLPLLQELAPVPTAQDG